MHSREIAVARFGRGSRRSVAHHDPGRHRHDRVKVERHGTGADTALTGPIELALARVHCAHASTVSRLRNKRCA